MKIGHPPIATAIVVITALIYSPKINAFTPTPNFRSNSNIFLNLNSKPLYCKHTPLHAKKVASKNDKSVTNISEASDKFLSPLTGAHNAIRQCLALSSILCAVVFCPVDLSPSVYTGASDHCTPFPLPQLVLHPPASLAAEYSSLTEEQKAVAEAWRIVDNSFFDRTFNNQDWFKLRQEYVVKKKYKTMDEAQGAIEKIVATLGDKYTRYLPPAKYRSIVDAATGTLAGVGVQISFETDAAGANRMFVADIEPNSPASIGGIQRGDSFLEVDGVLMNDGKSTPDDVAAKLRGPVSSKVGIVMERSGKTIDFILTRKPIVITTVRSYMSSAKNSAGKVGVIRIKSFSGTTSATVSETIVDLKKQGAEVLVLDVHGNPGGLLPGGTDTASLFLDVNKPLVFVVDKKGVIDAQSSLNVGLDIDIPLVIYTDGATASAAEVMTAALKENGRATVVGKKTFGKGIIQTIRQLGEDNGGVAITVARYETPKHNDINKNGIDVDIDVDCNDEDVAVCIPSSAFKKP